MRLLRRWRRYAILVNTVIAAALPGVAFVGAMALLTLYALARSPAIGWTLASYFVVLAPTSSILPLAHELVAERRMYLALLTVVVVVVLALSSA